MLAVLSSNVHAARGGGGGGGGGGGRGGDGSDSGDDSESKSAQFYGLCVDSSDWYISQDGVDGTYTQMYPGDRADGWSSITGFQVDTITADTVLKVTCEHNGPRMLDYNGLFIGSITYDGQDYYTSSPMSDSLWEVVDTTAGSLDMSVYCPKAGVSSADFQPCLTWNPSGSDIDGPVMGGQTDWG